MMKTTNATVRRKHPIAANRTRLQDARLRWALYSDTYLDALVSGLHRKLITMQDFIRLCSWTKYEAEYALRTATVQANEHNARYAQDTFLMVRRWQGEFRNGMRSVSGAMKTREYLLNPPKNEEVSPILAVPELTERVDWPNLPDDIPIDPYLEGGPFEHLHVLDYLGGVVYRDDDEVNADRRNMSKVFRPRWIIDHVEEFEKEIGSELHENFAYTVRKHLIRPMSNHTSSPNLPDLMYALDLHHDADIEENHVQRQDSLTSPRPVGGMHNTALVLEAYDRIIGFDDDTFQQLAALRSFPSSAHKNERWSKNWRAFPPSYIRSRLGHINVYKKITPAAGLPAAAGQALAIIEGMIITTDVDMYVSQPNAVPVISREIYNAIMDSEELNKLRAATVLTSMEPLEPYEPSESDIHNRDQHLYELSRLNPHVTADQYPDTPFRSHKIPVRLALYDRYMKYVAATHTVRNEQTLHTLRHLADEMGAPNALRNFRNAHEKLFPTDMAAIKRSSDIHLFNVPGVDYNGIIEKYLTILYEGPEANLDAYLETLT